VRKVSAIGFAASGSYRCSNSLRAAGYHSESVVRRHHRLDDGQAERTTEGVAHRRGTSSGLSKGKTPRLRTRRSLGWSDLPPWRAGVGAAVQRKFNSKSARLLAFENSSFEPAVSIDRHTCIAIFDRADLLLATMPFGNVIEILSVNRADDNKIDAPTKCPHIVIVISPPCRPFIRNSYKFASTCFSCTPPMDGKQIVHLWQC
jgi:hypothetical protein